MKRALLVLSLTVGLSAAAGVWCYRPYEYEAWMLQQMKDEANRGVLHFGHPGKYLRLSQEPKAFYSETPVAGYEAIPGVPGVQPHRRMRPTTRQTPKLADGIYDLGHLDVGYVYAEAGYRPNLFVGESLPEVRNSDWSGFEQLTLMVPAGPNLWRSDVPVALRYYRFTTEIRGTHFLSQVDWREPAGGFACGDVRKERLWRTGAETLRLCTRTFLIDGIKRDRLPWAGDLAVEIMGAAYSFGDQEPIKRTLAMLGSGDVRAGHVNGIAGYSLWWVVGHDLLQLYFDEPDFLRLHYPRICERMDEIATHEDERGFFAKDLGWDFIDWQGRKGGSLKSEITLQVIYFGALKAAARLAERSGDATRAAAWREKAKTLGARILAAGMDATRHARMMAIVFGLVEGETAARYAKEIAADDLPPTGTPYMASFEVMALVKGGETAAALRKFESVWGAMLDFGADAYWEGWNAEDKGEEVYEFYGRPFAKSLCHAWSSGPAFLIPGTFLGVRPTADGWKTWEAAPAVPAFAPNAKVKVPSKHGVREVIFREGKVSVP